MNDNNPEFHRTPSESTPTTSNRKRPFVVAAAALACIALGVLIAAPLRDGLAMLRPDVGQPGATPTDDKDGSGVTLYQSGMHPWIITTEPGNCPICGMKLEPIDPAKLTGEVTIDPTVVQNLGVRTAEVIEGPVTRSLRTVGMVEVAEPLMRDVNLRVSGWIESLDVDFVGATVERGDPLFTLYSPELYAAQEELILSAARSTGDAELLVSAGDRLLNFGLTEAQVQGLADGGKAMRNVPILSPYPGVVLQKHANEGMRVDPGMRVFRIGDLTKVWVQVTLYEYQLPFVAVGLPATMSLSAIPGKDYTGEVVFIDPTVNPQTRAVQVRLAFDNADGRLKPGMFADVTLRNTLEVSATLAPQEAVIDTGERSVAFVSLGQGRFEPRQIRTGVAVDGGQVEVLDGLAPGERVVTSGQFLLDSEASVRESLARMVQGEPAGQQKPVVATAPAASTSGVLTAAAQQQIDTLSSAYLAVQDKLTRDSLAGVEADRARLQEAARHLGHLGPPQIQAMAEAVVKTAGFPVDGLDAVRESFGPLSDATIELLKAAPPSARVAPDDATVYVTHCPMVNKDWLQVGDAIRNPYAPYMLTCGSVELALGKAEATTAAPVKAMPEQPAKPADTGEPMPNEPAPAPEVETMSSASEDAADMQQQIDRVAAAYLAIQDQLTRDSLDGIEAELATLREAATHLGHLAPGVRSLSEPLAAAAGFPVGDIDAVRGSFGALSDAVIALLNGSPPSTAATPDDETVYLTHCPMVNKDWLQVGDAIRNPYDTGMLRCGVLKSPLPQAATAKKPETPDAR